MTSKAEVAAPERKALVTVTDEGVPLEHLVTPVAVWWFLLLNHEDGFVWLSQREIGEAIGKSRGHTSVTLNALHRAGAIGLGHRPNMVARERTETRRGRPASGIDVSRLVALHNKGERPRP